MNRNDLKSPIATHLLSAAANRLYIDGEWMDSASNAQLECVNPATGAVFAQVASGNTADVDLAVAAARRALDGPWRDMTPYERQAIILELADLVDANFDDLCLLDSMEMGAPLQRLRANSRKRALGRLRFYAGMATAIHGHTIPNSAPGRVLTYTVREPIGVVAGIIPWNAPMTSAIWKIGPVLATGCTMVLKPAEQASLSCLMLAELITQAGVPAGVVNVVTGLGEATGAALAEHPGVNKVAFTGSHAVGQSIVRASAGNLKRVSLELGGKSPDIVFADADLDKAVPGAAMGVFGNTGQVCCAGTRLFVERKIYDEFVQRVARFGDGLRVGNGQDPAVEIGPVVSGSRWSGCWATSTSAGARAHARSPAGRGSPTAIWPGDISSSQRCSAMWKTACGSPPRKSSGRSCAPSRSTPWMRSNGGPTPRRSAWVAASGRATSTRHNAYRGHCMRVPSGSIATT